MSLGSYPTSSSLFSFSFLCLGSQAGAGDLDLKVLEAKATALLVSLYVDCIYACDVDLWGCLLGSCTCLYHKHQCVVTSLWQSEALLVQLFTFLSILALTKGFGLCDRSSALVFCDL